jgi:DNA-binding NtrC family response regulator
MANDDAPVLLVGERGAGFDGTARALHRAGPRAGRLYLRVDAATLPASLVSRRLFGHARNAFTDAVAAEEGLLGRARGGTVYLDEVDALPRDAQLQLLRAIEAGEILPVGAREPVAIDVRLVAGSCVDLASRVAAGEFEEQLYARLAAGVLPLPPLRDRTEDVPVLVAALVRHHNLVLGCRYQGADEGALAALAAEPWSGNLSGLETAVAFAMLAGDGEWIRAADLPRRVSAERAALLAPEDDDLRTVLRAFERAHIVAVLERLDGNKRTAAVRLGVSLSSLYRKLDELHIPLG